MKSHIKENTNIIPEIRSFLRLATSIIERTGKRLSRHFRKDEPTARGTVKR